MSNASNTLEPVIRALHPWLNQMIGGTVGPTYGQWIVREITNAQFQRRLGGGVPLAFDLVQPSLAEDWVVSTLVADEPRLPLLIQEKWAERLGLNRTDILFGIGGAEAARISGSLNMTAVREYLLVVANNTLELAGRHTIADLLDTVGKERVEKAVEAGILAPGVEDSDRVVAVYSTNSRLRMLLHVIGCHGYTHLGGIEKEAALAGVGHPI